MREGAKQRLAGAVVIVALAVIFVPMLFEPESLSPPPIQESIPRAPAFDPDTRSEVFLGPQDQGAGGVDDSQLTESQPLALPPAGDLEPASAGDQADSAPAAGGTSSNKLPPASESAKAVSAPMHQPVDLPSPPAAPKPVAPRGPADGMPSWVIQVASLATSESAAELEAKLRKGGFSAFVEKAEVNGKLYYRVRVGPEVDRTSAERTAARLHERFKLETLVQSYP